MQQLGIRGQLMSPCQYALPELSECDSDDCGDENENPVDETREVSEIIFPRGGFLSPRGVVVNWDFDEIIVYMRAVVKPSNDENY